MTGLLLRYSFYGIQWRMTLQRHSRVINWNDGRWGWKIEGDLSFTQTVLCWFLANGLMINSYVRPGV